MLERLCFVKHKDYLFCRFIFFMEHGINNKAGDLGRGFRLESTVTEMVRTKRPSKGRRVKETP